MKFYSLKRIQSRKATYNVVFGERSNGKTYAALRDGLANYFKTGGQMAYLRRWKEDVTGRRASRLFAGLNENGEVAKLSGGVYSGVHYYAGKFYLCNYDENGKALYNDTAIIAFAFALSDSEHDKSTSYPNVTSIIFDEFITNKLYLHDEFVIFMNVVSTIVRRREDVVIYMLGNTVSKFCPYFAEMGLKNISKMEQGTIDVYAYGNSKLKVAVEFCNSLEKTEKANSYFAFDNPKLNMITGGAWELNIHPHLPEKFTPKDVVLEYFIEFNDQLFSAKIIRLRSNLFTYIHRKTTDVKNIDRDLVFTDTPNHRRNYIARFYYPTSKIHAKIVEFFKTSKVFYQDNEVGECIANFLRIGK